MAELGSVPWQSGPLARMLKHRAVLSPQKRNGNNWMGWEERTEDSIYVLFLPKKKKNYTINDSHLRPHSVFPQDTPYMRELH